MRKTNPVESGRFPGLSPGNSVRIPQGIPMNSYNVSYVKYLSIVQVRVTLKCNVTMH